MEPVVPITGKKKTERLTARGTLADLITCAIAAVSGAIAFIYSILFFTRFLENDTHLWGVLSAFLLCFGVGAFGYVPAFLISLIAWKAHKRGASKTALLWALFLGLPWLFLAIILTFISDMPKLYSLPILVTAVLLTAWALISLYKNPSQ